MGNCCTIDEELIENADEIRSVAQKLLDYFETQKNDINIKSSKTYHIMTEEMKPIIKRFQKETYMSDCRRDFLLKKLTKIKSIIVNWIGVAKWTEEYEDSYIPKSLERKYANFSRNYDVTKS